jgi:DNA modification methylase
MSMSNTSTQPPISPVSYPTPELMVDYENVKIYQGDCRAALAVCPEASVSLIFTSPPYPGVPQPEPDYVTFPDPKDFNSAHDVLEQVWRTCYNLLEDEGRLCINIYDIPTGKELGVYPNVAATIKRCLGIGFVLRETFIWDKGAGYSPPSGSWPYPKGVLSANTYEPILVFQKPLQFSQRKVKTASDYPESVREAAKLGPTEHAWLMDPIWRISAEREGRALGHPFTFPVELAERFIRLYSFPTDTVLDPFVGSGTTCETARVHGRAGIGFELSDKYIEICRKRFQRQSLFG